MAEPSEIAFVADVLAAAGRALEATEPVSQRLEVAGVRIDLHYAGPALFDAFAPAFEHLVVDDDGAPDTVLRIWDSASTGVDVPTPPVPSTRFTDRGDILGFVDPVHRTAFHWSEYSVCVLDTDLGLGSYWVSDSAHLPYWSKSAPLRTILGWVLEQHGHQLVHGAAVATEDGATLIVGRGGSGKSTTALSSLVGGLDFLGDDYVAVTADPPTVSSLYATAKIADAGHPAAARLPQLPGTPGDEKLVLSLHPAEASRLRRSAPLRAIVLPEIVDAETTRMAPVGRTRLERAATFTTLAQLPGAGATTRARLARLIDLVPGGLLLLGRDRSDLVEVVRGLCAGRGAAPVTAESDDLPLLSVIIPVYNGARFLASAVESILEQDYPHLELIVVDDGSYDDLASVIAGLPVDIRLHHQANSGPAVARNVGLALATGDVVAFLDVDDRFAPGALLALVREWVDGDAPVVMGSATIVQLDPETGVEQPAQSDDTLFPYYIATAVYERGVFDRIGGFDPEMRFGEDTDWFARLQEEGEELRRVPHEVLVVRRHGGNMTEGLGTVELHVVRAVKKALDRRRARERGQ